MTDAVEKIAAAVLYEGYVLWPYRRSAQKNQKRWTFGGVYPRAFSETAGTNDPWLMQTQCLVTGEEPTVEVKVRFLHVVERKVGCKDARGTLEFVDELRVGNDRYLAWEEAAEREVVIEGLELAELATPRRIEIKVPAGSEEEPLAEEGGEVVGALVRRWLALEGTVEVGAEPVGDELFRLTVRISNTTPWEGQDRESALRQTFVSTHTVLRVAGGEFVSLMDPPDGLEKLAEGCENVKTWPVLAGEEGQRRIMLSSPIILYDYPEDRAREPRRPLRRRGDGSAAHPEHPRPHGRGEGRDACHRPAGAGDPGPQRVAHRRGHHGLARRGPGLSDAEGRRVRSTPSRSRAWKGRPRRASR